MLRGFCVLLLIVPLVAAAQDTPEFDAVVVRQHDRSDPSTDGGIHWDGLVFEAKNVPLTFLMTQAFGVKKWLIVGLPAWAEKSTWDMNAKVSAGDLKLMQNLTREQRSRMLQTILGEQFGLRYHFEDRVQPVYELSVLPDGPRFKPSPVPQPANGAPSKRRTRGWTFSEGEVACDAITMAQFANEFSPLVERVVIDRTGLAGMYEIALRWTPEEKPVGEDEGAPGVFTALREQLGLKLTSAKASVPAVVIDAMHAPEAD